MLEHLKCFNGLKKLARTGEHFGLKNIKDEIKYPELPLNISKAEVEKLKR